MRVKFFILCLIFSVSNLYSNELERGIELHPPVFSEALIPWEIEEEILDQLPGLTLLSCSLINKDIHHRVKHLLTIKYEMKLSHLSQILKVLSPEEKRSFSLKMESQTAQSYLQERENHFKESMADPRINYLELPQECTYLRVFPNLVFFKDIHKILYMNLGNQSLFYLHSSIGLLENLLTLDLSANRLIKLTPELWSLKKLKSLNLKGNPLLKDPCFPEKVEDFSLPCLQVLGVEQSILDGLAPFPLPPGLTVCYASSLHTVPPELRKKGIFFVDLEEGKMEGGMEF